MIANYINIKAFNFVNKFSLPVSRKDTEHNAQRSSSVHTCLWRKELKVSRLRLRSSVS